MSNLLSGMLGALITSLITIIYFLVNERVNNRKKVALESIEYIDEIYDLCQQIHVSKDAEYAGVRTKLTLTEEEYRKCNRRLKTLVISSRTHAHVALTYGDKSIELNNFTMLSNSLTGIAMALFQATPSNWNSVSASIHKEFEEVIDPARVLIERNLINKAKSGKVFDDFADSLSNFE